MAISKTENETYRLRLYYPQDIQEMIGVNKLYSKTFKTRKEAKEAGSLLLLSLSRIQKIFFDFISYQCLGNTR